jgi:hypothetical protein
MVTLMHGPHPVPDSTSSVVGEVEMEIQEAIEKGALFPYVGKEAEVYRCPADIRMKDPRQTAYRSYSIANGANGEDWPGTHVPAEKYSEIKSPGSKYIFLEDVDQEVQMSAPGKSTSVLNSLSILWLCGMIRKPLLALEMAMRKCIHGLIRVLLNGARRLCTVQILSLFI